MGEVEQPLSLRSLTPQLAIARQHYHQQRFAQTEDICRQLIALLEDIHHSPEHEQSDDSFLLLTIDIHMLFGMALHQQGKLDDAEECYEHIIQLSPSHAPAYNNLALVFKAQGDYETAIHWLEQAIAIHPDGAAAYNNLGNVLKQQGQVSHAQTAYEHALERDPQNLDARLNLGLVFRARGEIKGAIAQYQDILKRDPTFVDAYNELGNLLQACNQFDDAIRCYEAGLHHAPSAAAIHNNLGAALQEMGRHDEAIAAYHRALHHRPAYADAYYNLGNALRSLDRLDEASVAYRKALVLNPTTIKVHNNLGLVLHDQGRLREAIACYRHAIEQDPNYPDAHLNLGLSLLMDGDVVEGFTEYEWRWRVTGRDFKPPRSFAQPVWDGRALQTQTLFIHAEQGLGDTLQFIRYIPLITDRVHHIIVECQSPVARLLRTMPAIHQVIVSGDPVPDFDAHTPLMSLPHILGTSLATLPSHTPYLVPPLLEDKDTQLCTSTECGDEKTGAQPSAPTSLNIGIVWAGSPTHRNDRHRSCPFQQFARLLDLSDVKLYSLQKGVGETAFANGGDEVINLAPHLNDMADTAAAIAQLDLVITVDTSVAHLAGALGKPVWIVLGSVYDWRWLRDRTDSPWYPTARLFHQHTPGNWEALFDDVIYTLQSCINQNTPLIPSQVEQPIHRQPAVTDELSTVRITQLQLTQLQQAIQQQRWDDAIAQCRAILEEDPDQPQALETLGRIAYQQKHYDMAIAHFEQLCRLYPVDDSIWSQLGNAHLHSGHPDAAIPWYRHYLEAQPKASSVRNNLGVALRALGLETEAIAHYRFILEQDPQSVDTYFNLANVLREQERLEEAVAAYREVVTRQPDYAHAWNNLANALKDLNRVDEAIACYRNTIDLMPNHASAHHNLGYAFLLKGDLRQGFAEYEWRWRVKNFKAPRTYKQPLWDGAPLHGKTILLYTEQGFGDTIQFIRYGSLVAEQGGRVVVECRPPLARLLRSLPAIAAIALRDSPLPHFDVHAPLMSLPYILGTTIDTIPCQTPYLFPPSFAENVQLDRSLSSGRDSGISEGAQLCAAAGGVFKNEIDSGISEGAQLCAPAGGVFKNGIDSDALEGAQLCAPTGGVFKIGIVWAGSPTHKNDHNRSCPFAYFWKLLRTPNAQFFSLQKGPRSTDIADYCDVDWPFIDLSDRLHDFADTAAAIAQLDLVITVDTSVAHLAAALGKPTWVVLSYAPDWRWMLDRDDSSWYPTVRLFRQPQPGDWTTVFAHIQTALQTFAKQEAGDRRQEAGDRIQETEGGRNGAEGQSNQSKIQNPTSNVQRLRPIGIGIELSTSTGWGIFGTNLTLQLLKSPEWNPIVLLSPLAGSRFNPLHQALLDPLLDKQQTFKETVAQHPNKPLHLPHLVLKALGNHFVSTPQLETMTGTPNVGLIFFEDTALTAVDIEKAQDYDLIVAGSSWNADVLRSHGIHHVETVCQGIDSTLFHPAPRSGLLGDRFVIFSGGKLEYRKGQDIVIEAFRRFHQHHPDALLLTAWHNIWPQTIRSLEQSKYITGLPELDSEKHLQLVPWLESNGIPSSAVRELGAIANPLMGQLMREADVALFPNRCEGGTNLVAMECLACGVPTILSANTGHLDLLNDGLGYGLNRQQPVQSTTPKSQQGWGESDVDEILNQLETMYTHRADAKANALNDAQVMHDEWSWEEQVKRLMTVLGDRHI